MKSSLILQRIGDLLSTEFKINYERRLPYGSVAIGEYKLFLFMGNQNNTTLNIASVQDDYVVNVVLATRLRSVESDTETDYIDFMDKVDELIDFFKQGRDEDGEALGKPYFLKLECENGRIAEFRGTGINTNYTTDDKNQSINYATMSMQIINYGY